MGQDSFGRSFIAFLGRRLSGCSEELVKVDGLSLPSHKDKEGDRDSRATDSRGSMSTKSIEKTFRRIDFAVAELERWKSRISP
jgi:hypothetical protein